MGRRVSVTPRKKVEARGMVILRDIDISVVGHERRRRWSGSHAMIPSRIGTGDTNELNQWVGRPDAIFHSNLK